MGAGEVKWYGFYFSEVSREADRIVNNFNVRQVLSPKGNKEMLWEVSDFSSRGILVAFLEEVGYVVNFEIHIFRNGNKEGIIKWRG